MEVRLERATRLPRPPWWVAALVLLWVGLIAFTSSAFFGPPDAPTTCHFRALTSVPCAGCGGARGARMILDGRPAAAFDLNPGLFALLTVWGALFLRRLATGERIVVRFTPAGRRIAWVVGVLAFVASWAYVIWRQGIDP